MMQHIVKVTLRKAQTNAVFFTPVYSCLRTKYFPANIHLFNAIIEILEKGVKYVQS